jgi:hypothetical protein
VGIMQPIRLPNVFERYTVRDSWEIPVKDGDGVAGKGDEKFIPRDETLRRSGGITSVL